MKKANEEWQQCLRDKNVPQARDEYIEITIAKFSNMSVSSNRELQSK